MVQLMMYFQPLVFGTQERSPDSPRGLCLHRGSVHSRVRCSKIFLGWDITHEQKWMFLGLVRPRWLRQVIPTKCQEMLCSASHTPQCSFHHTDWCIQKGRQLSSSHSCRALYQKCLGKK